MGPAGMASSGGDGRARRHGRIVQRLGDALLFVVQLGRHALAEAVQVFADSRQFRGPAGLVDVEQRVDRGAIELQVVELDLACLGQGADGRGGDCLGRALPA